MEGRIVYIDSSVPFAIRTDCERAVRNYGASLAESRELACTIVVNSLDQIGARVSWVLVLKGGYVCNPTFIMKNGTAGTQLSYINAQNGRRIVWVSKGFSKDYPGVHNVISTLIGANSSKWTVCKSLDLI